jgi:rod shape-determining protein MreC
LSQRQIRFLFVALLVGQLFLLASQEPDRGGARNLLEGTALRGLGPVARLVNGVGDAFASASNAARTRRQLLADNERLRAELLELRRSELRREGLEQENEELARALAFARRQGAGLRPVEVVYADYGSWLRALILHVGEGAAPAVRLNQPVLTDEGLVGRVVRRAGAYVKVQLVNDRAAAVGVQLERSRRQGVLRGSKAGELLIDFVPRQAEIEVGERVLTAGIDGVYPRGIPVGTVAAVEPGSEAFHRIVVRPAVDFSRLTFVYLLEAESAPPELLAEDPRAPD